MFLFPCFLTIKVINQQGNKDFPLYVFFFTYLSKFHFLWLATKRSYFWETFLVLCCPQETLSSQFLSVLSNKQRREDNLLCTYIGEKLIALKEKKIWKALTPMNTSKEILPCVLMIPPLEPKLWTRWRSKRRYKDIFWSVQVLLWVLVFLPLSRGFHIAKSSVNPCSAAVISNHTSLSEIQAKHIWTGLCRSLRH